MKRLGILLCLFPFLSFAQELKLKNTQGGTFSLGMRSTLSAFNEGTSKDVGTGVGGQFRLQVANKVNTDWFFDYLKSDIEDYAFRTDYHIGWSVLYYPTKNLTPKVRPYILAGHCFDYTKLVENNNSLNSMKRLSSAVQGGIGMHWNLTQRFDLSFVTQYMIHLGTDIHAHRTSMGVVSFEEHQGASLEGHLLFHLGLNYKIVDLW